MKVGEEHEIRLPGMASAGYHWFGEIEEGQGAVEVEKRWADLAPGSVGTSADEIFTVTARRAGRARLRFEQRRRWEEASADAIEVTVEVQD
jgi:predicted secreted protein